MNQEIIVIIVILITLFLFIQGKLRYDFVAILTLLALVFTKVISAETAFKGFGHPAIITVASVLVISAALTKTGAVDQLVHLLNKGPNKTYFKVLSLMIITAILSAFMNNIGALALILPTALRISKDNKISPSKLLMPVAFASLLGGMITSIGTPPNLIVSSFRKDLTGEAFSFLDFAPIGIGLSLVGIIFTSFFGWKLIPHRDSKGLKEKFDVEDYLFELIVTDKCSSKGIKLKDFFQTYKMSFNIVSIVRSETQIVSPGAHRKIFPGDILIVKSMPTNLKEVIKKACLEIKGAKTDKLISEKSLKSEEIALVEVVLRNDSHLIGRTAVETKLRNRYNANLIAVSRKGVHTINRIKNFKFQTGDVLLLQVPRTSLNDLYSKMKALPLQEQPVDITIQGFNKKRIITILLFSAAILLAIFNILPVHITFLSTAIFLVIFKVVTPREFNDSIDWPTIIMIGALFALGDALEASGASDTIASVIFNISKSFPPSVILSIVMLLTILLTNIINTTAATILVLPIAVSVASYIGVSVDPFLMAVVVGAAASFLTPIAHQSNTLVMGPGGYKFTDYWKLGLPLTIISLLVGIPLILLIWPF